MPQPGNNGPVERGGSIMQSVVTAGEGPWYGTLTRAQWKTLFASNLGWMFDGYETFALILTVGVALRQLLDSSLYPQIPAYAGTVIALTLLGWGIGGLIGGTLAAFLGRRGVQGDRTRPTS